MAKFVMRISAQQRIETCMSIGIAGRLAPVSHIGPVFAENDNQAAGEVPLEDGIRKAVRTLLQDHGPYAARQLANLAQAAFWRGDMAQYHHYMACAKPLNQAVSAAIVTANICNY
jgi:hypothetical protein